MIEKFQKLLTLSLAAKITAVVFLSMLALTIIAWCVYQLDPQRVAWADYMTAQRGLLLLLLLVATAVGVFYAARLWLEESPAKRNDVEQAWRAGVEAMDRVGLSIRDMPVYLMLGCPAATQQQLLTAANQKWLIQEPARGSSTLNWFVTQEAVYLFCGSTGVLGKTIEKLRSLKSREFSEAMSSEEFSTMHSRFVAGAEGEHANTVALASTSPDATAGSNSAAGSASANGDDLAVAVQTASSTQTLAAGSSQFEQSVNARIDSVDQLLADAIRDEPLSSSWQVGSAAHRLDARLEALSSVEVVEGQRNLLDLSTHLRSLRRPAAAINGIGVVVAATDIANSQTSARQCGLSMRSDLDQVRRVLGVDAPVSLIVSGMESLPGVGESIRRLGPHRSARNQLGATCDPREVLDAAGLESIVDQGLRSIGDLVYDLFREPGALTTPGNESLVQLQIACRRSLATPLKILAREGLADRVQDTKQASYFSGIFFVACGQRATARAFATAVFERLASQQQWLSWTTSEQRVQNRYTRLSFVLGALSVVAATYLCVSLFS